MINIPVMILEERIKENIDEQLADRMNDINLLTVTLCKDHAFSTEDWKCIFTEIAHTFSH